MKPCGERVQRSVLGICLGEVGRGLTAMALVACASASVVRAEEAQRASDVTLDVVLVYGSADEGAVDPGLSGMQEYLQSRLPMRFGTLEKFDSKSVELELGEPFDLPLPSGSELVNVLPIAIVNGYLHLYLEMPGVNTRLQIKSVLRADSPIARIRASRSRTSEAKLRVRQRGAFGSTCGGGRADRGRLERSREAFLRALSCPMGRCRDGSRGRDGAGRSARALGSG